MCASLELRWDRRLSLFLFANRKMTSSSHLSTLVLAWAAFTSQVATAGDPPAEVRPRLAAGNVAFEFYDPNAVRRNWPGMTLFVVEARRRFTYRYRTDQRGETQMVSIDVTHTENTFQIRHRIQLPERYDRDDKWRQPLVLHELDHVAISTHPRLALLADSLTRSVRVVKKSLPVGEELNDERIGELINEAINAKTGDLDDLVQFNYDLLDRLTDHGEKPLPDRDEFLRMLYDKPNLDAAKFPHTGEVLPLLEDEKYRRAVEVAAAGSQAE